ncbi:MAG: bifunctional diguanylate cyclase/phosphodiesterase, partial [Silicimonas sp.]|nr:bifunctional diguanylate cyclase/phosphodiesterase [Silicimonas sp.]
DHSGADQSGATTSAGDATPEVRFTKGAFPGDPHDAADVTFLRRIGPDAYELRLFMDVTAMVARIRLMTWMGALIVTVTLSGAGLVVARVAARSSRAAHLSERQARYLAEHDTLTGLFNRFGFGARARALLQKCAETGKRAYLFQVDADKFKDINDIYGHATGDRVIEAIARMLRGAFPEGALVARLGGDEFAILVTEAVLNGAPSSFMSSLPTGTEIRSEDGNSLIEVSTSSGFAVFPDDAPNLGDLMKAADLALYAVKNAGRNGVGAYRRDMTRALERRHWELQGVRNAIEAGQLVPYYQPLICARTGRVEAVEALARWHHPTYGVLGPDRFRHALDDARVSTEITAAMLEQVARDLRVWRNIGHGFSAGLNIGEADLKDPDLTGRITDMLARSGLHPDALAIEVTETAVTAVNTAAAGPLLKRYRDAGGVVALDDFGTGNSSITLLKSIPYSAVKIDRSFIRDLTHNETDLAIVRSIVRLARDMGFKIVAEGIETPDQVRLLRKLRVDLLQGFVFSKPLPARQLSEYLEWSSPPRRKASPGRPSANAA